jgi:hypothetical protein
MPMTSDLTNFTNNISVRSNKTAQEKNLKTNKGFSTSSKLTSSTRGISPSFNAKPTAPVELSIKNKSEQIQRIGSANQGGTPISSDQQHRVAFNHLNSSAGNAGSRPGSAPKARRPNENGTKLNSSSTPSAQQNALLQRNTGSSSGLNTLTNSNSGAIGGKDSTTKHMLKSFGTGPVK